MLGMSDLMRKKTELDPSDSDCLNLSTIPAYFAPVKNLLDMNDVALPWKRIYKTFPKKNNRRILRGWSLEEIRDILKHCGSSKYRAMVHKMHKKKDRRFDVPLIHGFRSFWNKVMKDAVSDDSPALFLTKKEYMMGHGGFSSLDRSYYYAHRSELAKEYMHAVPELTIDESERLRLPNARKDVEIIKLESKALRIAKLEEMVAELTGRVGP